MINQEQIKFLVNAVIGEKAGAKEMQELAALIKQDESGETALYVEELMAGYGDDSPLSLQFSEIEAMSAAILQADRAIAPRVIPLWKRMAVAASILLVTGAATYFLFFQDPKPPAATVVQNTDVPAPAANRARITLANGQTIYLDSAAQGELAVQGSVRVIKQGNGVISYEGAGAAEMVYNTLTNPRGSQAAELTLADGTKVWLNAESSITYPTAFIGDERKVSITGEAYFEVNPLPASPGVGGAGTGKRPFIVKKDDMEVTVLGTHFNVNAYDDESHIKVTLLEGSVKVAVAGKTQIIKPGQQTQVDNDENIKLLNNIDIDAVVAWKNGYFSFKNADLRIIMRQAARWYDVELDFEGAIPDVQFSGEIGRDLTLNQFLRILDKTRIGYKIEGKKLIITP